LHFPEQLRAAAALPPASPAAVASPEEQHLAGLLIDAACQPIVWSNYRDDSAEQLRVLIQAKLQGRTLAAPVAEELPILRLVDALKRSVAQALQQPSAHSAEANQTGDAGASQQPVKKKPSRKATSRRSA
jgi:non-homologous end joining protein Ku